jgi:hypothetical protein
LFSYDGKLCWGLNGDRNHFSDLRAFVRALQASFDSLRTAARAARLGAALPARRPMHARGGRSAGATEPVTGKAASPRRAGRRPRA